jgi:hypothetical protein
MFMVLGMESGDVWGIQCEVPITEYMTRLAIKDITSRIGMAMGPRSSIPRGEFLY